MASRVKSGVTVRPLAVAVVPRGWKLIVSDPVPAAKVKFFPPAMVVSPLRETVDVPVEKVEAPVWEMLPGKVTV